MILQMVCCSVTCWVSGDHSFFKIMAVSSIVSRPSAWLPRIQPVRKCEVPTDGASQDLIWWRAELNGNNWRFDGRSVCFEGTTKCKVFTNKKIVKKHTDAQPSAAEFLNRAHALRLRAVAAEFQAHAQAADDGLDGIPSACPLSKK